MFSRTPSRLPFRGASVALGGKAAALVEVLPSLDGSEAKLLLLFLLHPDTTLATPVSTARLAARAGFSASQTQAALQCFVQQGWFERELRGSAGTCYRWRLGPEGAGPPKAECPVARNAGAPNDSGAPGLQKGQAQNRIGPGTSAGRTRRLSCRPPDWVSRGRKAMAALSPTAQESDWEWFLTSAGGEERLAMCLVWLHEVAWQSFEDAFRLKLRVRVECPQEIREAPQPV